MPRNKKGLTKVFVYAFYLLFVWTLYRGTLQLPDYLEEFFVKPAIWLVPLVYILKDKKKKLESLGITGKNLFPGIYLAIALGAVFAIEAILINFAKYDGFEFAANIGGQTIFVTLIISFATALTEEISFRGYLFNRFWEGFGNEWIANLITTLFWVGLHTPILVFAFGFELNQILVNLFLTTIYSIGAGFIFARTKNVFSPVVLHVLWSWPIILFR